ncbi:MAG TPA: hypothetical protein VL404_00520 [Candidatus Eisenbacteria bacterium]|nr:hypothetical protein [Candidatus Eisenbacteria bacterium]
MKFCRLVLASAILIFYNGVITHGVQTHHVTQRYMNVYNWLSASMQKGDLHVMDFGTNLPPDSGNMEKNFSWFAERGLGDLSLYKGKIYVYFGVTPAVTLYLPFQLLTRGLMISDDLAVLLFGYGGFLWIFALLVALRRRHYPQSPGWMELVSAAVLGFCNLLPYMMAGFVSVWQVAIASGYFYMSAALYFLFSRGLRDLSLRRGIAAGLALGLAVGCRPHFTVPAFFLLWLAYRLSPGKSARALATPFALCLAALAVYNLMRFDNPFEFGATYQLNPYKNLGEKIWKPSSWLSNLWCFFLQPPRVDPGHYPFLWPRRTPTFPSFIRPPKGYGTDDAAGFLASTPFVVFAAVAFLAQRLRFPGARASGATRPLPDEVRQIFSMAVLILAILCVHKWSSVRYEIDFATLLMVPAVLLWFHADDLAGGGGVPRFLIRRLGACFAVAGVLIHLAYAAGL